MVERLEHHYFYISCQFLLLSFSSMTFHLDALPTDVNDVINLNQGWVGWSSNMSSITFNANVPFTVHTRLVSEGFLKDPYYRFNDRDYRWVALDDWNAAVTFEGTSTLLNRSKINLVFESIDTVADVYLNNIKVGSSYSKFVANVFDVTGKVKRGRNEVLVHFVSPVRYAAFQSSFYKKMYNYSVLPNCYPDVLHGECHSNFIRKEPLSFGWDFGPSFPTQGLFKSVHIYAVPEIIIENLATNIKEGQSAWKIHVCAVVSNHLEEIPAFMDFKIVELGIDAVAHIKRNFPKGQSKVCISMTVVDEKVQRWWPRQYGGQFMYSLKARVLLDDQHELHAKEIKFGFRTVELVQEPISGSAGLSFYFRINGIDMFLKGSNWVPADALRDRVTTERIDSYLQSAVEANMNVLRVWAGGGYESDYFYDVCDKLGILIWHDFMFACAMYPTNPEFLHLVENEVTHQIKRLQNHPSIFVWSANNENEVALRENWYGTAINFQLYKQDYIALYVKTVQIIARKLDPSRPFIVSSPSNALESEQEGWIAKDPRSPLYGDVHYYNYTANCWNSGVFPNPRFASEYGYQSYPSFAALKNVSLEEDLVWNSTLMFYRQHHQDGNKQIEDMIKENFMLPKTSNKLVYFKQMIFLSQIVQAVCVTMETEHYRSLMGRLVKVSSEEDGNNSHFDANMVQNITRTRISSLEGHTMGAMYWQLNDVWQAPSWSSLEYRGKWKMLHFYARNFFRDIAITYKLHGISMDLYVVSDYLEAVEATLNVTSYKWSSLDALVRKEFEVIIPHHVSSYLMTLNTNDFCGQLNQCFLILCLNVNDFPNYSYARPAFLTPFNKIDGLSNPWITIPKSTMEMLSANLVHFSIRVAKPAPFLWVSSSIEGRFSDNGFIQYEARKTVNFTAKNPLSLDDFSKSLTVISLYDVTVG